MFQQFIPALWEGKAKLPIIGFQALLFFLKGKNHAAADFFRLNWVNGYIGRILAEYKKQIVQRLAKGAVILAKNLQRRQVGILLLHQLGFDLIRKLENAPGTAVKKRLAQSAGGPIKSLQPQPGFPSQAGLVFRQIVQMPLPDPHRFRDAEHLGAVRSQVNPFIAHISRSLPHKGQKGFCFAALGPTRYQAA